MNCYSFVNKHTLINEKKIYSCENKTNFLGTNLNLLQHLLNKKQNEQLRRKTGDQFDFFKSLAQKLNTIFDLNTTYWYDERHEMKLK